eukprot:4215315-Amphidinium_carterae.1
MLRPSELCNLRRCDLVLSHDVGGDECTGVVCIPHSKTSNRFAKLQSVIIDDVLLLRALAQQFSADAPHRYIIGGSMSLLVKTFLAIKDALGLKHTPYVLA